MSFKTRFLIAFLVISVFILSSCEVYNSLTGKPVQEVEEKAASVVRVEGELTEETLAEEVYATATATEHDPFKVGENPLGPFEGGKNLGFTLQQWLDASGIGIYSVNKDNAQLDLSFKNLVPNGVYTVWCSRIKFPPEPGITDKPCGADDGSENSFTADEKGSAAFSVKLKALEPSTEEVVSAIAIAYHSDGKTYGAEPGDFGSNTHVQLFYMLPEPKTDATKFEVPIKFVNHLQAELPEQDVFVELEETMEEPTGEVIGEAPEEAPEEEAAEEVLEEVVEEEPTEEAPEEEAAEEVMEEKPIVIVVQETDLVSLAPEAEDPDSETTLVFTFTSPLDENGEWQTTYGDSGEYTITVTASDGESTTSRDVLIIVNKREEAPVIDVARPIESVLRIDELQGIEFSAEASDLNNDPLTYSWKIDGNEAGTESSFTYETTYEDAGSHTVKVEVSDGLSSDSRIWSIDVDNVNRLPALEAIDDITVKETDTVTITALATDDDQDSITYSISDNRFGQEDNVFTWETDYDSAGVYEVTVSSNDGQDTTEQTFTLTVENVNRPPVIKDITQK
jgi:hypothetical protein